MAVLYWKSHYNEVEVYFEMDVDNFLMHISDHRCCVTKFTTILWLCFTSK